MNTLYVFLAQLALNAFILVLSLCLWKIVWVEQYPTNIPKGGMQLSVSSFIDHRKEFYKAETFTEIMAVMYRALSDFNPTYWIENVGFDGYSYLFLQRKFLGFLVSLIIMGLLLIGLEIGLLSMEFNPYYYYFVESIYMPYKHSIFLFIVSAMFINMLVFVRKHLQTEYITRLFDKNKYRGLDWMKTRTIHVEGLLFNDLSGKALRRKIDTALEDAGLSQHVDQVLVVPAYARLLQLELKVRELEYGQQVLQGDDPFFKKVFLKMCLPKKFKDALTYESKKLSLEKKIDLQATQSFQGSGHAIICFESIEAAQFCLDKFSANRTILHIIFESISAACSRCFSKRERSRSFELRDGESESLQDAPDFSIICQEMPDPSDIAWVNLEGETRGIYIWRSFLINVFFLVMLLFFSTPTAIFAFLQKYFHIDFFSFKWTEYIPKPFGPLLYVYLPALVVVLLNQVVILFIDIFSFQERFQRHSVFQISIFKKYYLYLMFNVIIVPAFIMANEDSLYQIITGQVKINFYTSYKRLYTENHGMVFATIITQSAAISVFVYLNRIGDVFVNYLSTKLTYHRRVFQNDEQSYLREGDEVFQFGYFYAQKLVFISIILQFMLSSWWIIIAGVCFFFIKHCLDGYLLLAVHTREIESSGLMVKSVLRYAMIGLIFFQVQFLVEFWMKGDAFEITVCSVLIVFSLIVGWILRKPLFEIGQMEDKSIDYSRYNKNIIKAQWRQFYKHPLTVSSFVSLSATRQTGNAAQASLSKDNSAGFNLRQFRKNNMRQQYNLQDRGGGGGIAPGNRSSSQEENHNTAATNGGGSSLFQKDSHLNSTSTSNPNKSRFASKRVNGFATDSDHNGNDHPMKSRGRGGGGA